MKVLRISLIVLLIVSFAFAQTRPFSLDDALGIRELVGYNPIGVSSDGRHVAYATMNPALRLSASKPLPVSVFPVFYGSEIQLMDLHTKQIKSLTENWGVSYGQAWSPDGTKLAFFSGKGGRWELWVWDSVSDKMVCFDQYEASPSWPNILPVWASDSSKLYYVGLPKDTPRFVPPNDEKRKPVIVQDLREGHTKEKLINMQSRQGQVLQRQLDPLRIIIEVDLLTGSTREIASIKEAFRVWISPDDKMLAVAFSGRVLPNNVAQLLYDMTLIKVKPDGEQNTEAVQKDIPVANSFDNVSWSPDSAYIAVGTDGMLGGDIFLANTRTRKVTNLTKDLDVHKTKKSHRTDLSGSERLVPKFANTWVAPFWSGDSSTLYLLGQGDVWQVPVGDPKAAVNLTKGDPRNFVAFRNLENPGGKGSTVYVIAEEKSERRYELMEVDSGKLRSVFSVQGGKVVTCAHNTRPSENGLISIIRFSPTSPRDLYVLNPGVGQAQKFSLVIDATGIDFASRRVLKWKIPNGDEASGILFLPADAKPGKQFPLIVNIYPGVLGNADQIDRWWGGELTNGPELLAGHGYAVLMPDIPLTVGNVLRDTHDNLEPALDAAIATGFIDSNRMGVIGQSFGGYAVNSLAVQSIRLKCGVSVNGIAELTSNVVGFELGPMWAHNQGRLNSLPWEKPDLYVANSPAYFAAKAKMPVCIIAGAEDNIVSSTQSEIMFRALAMNDVPVEYAVYQGAGHSPNEWTHEQKRDYWMRVFDWFDYWLKKQ